MGFGCQDLSLVGTWKHLEIYQKSKGYLSDPETEPLGN